MYSDPKAWKRVLYLYDDVAAEWESIRANGLLSFALNRPFSFNPMYINRSRAI